MAWWMGLLMAGVFEEGVQLSSLGKWVEARAKFAEAARLEPRRAVAWKALGVAAGKVGDAVEAEEALRRGCELDPKLEDVCFYHARGLYALNRFEDALKVFARVDGKPGRTLVATGQAYEALGREKEAEDAFRNALLKPDARDEARLRFGVFLFRAGRLDEAERILKEAVKEREGFGEAMGELGRVYYQAGRMRDAVAMLEQAQRSRPDLEWIALLLERARLRL